MDYFWQKLNKPFTALAPLDGVTDVAFRQIITEIGKPDVLFTEFTACAGILSSGSSHVAENLLFSIKEQPIVAQIWGHDPSQFYTVAKKLKKMGFAGIDINMGCPIKKIIKNGACAALIQNPDLAVDIIRATQKGAGDLPVSVKSRIGNKDESIDDWIGVLLKQNLPALTVHLRTVSEMSKPPAHWEYMPRIIKLRDKLSPSTLIIGNGDIDSLSDIDLKYKQYGCDGFMVGRGIFKNPWLFNKAIDIEKVTISERIELYLLHIEYFTKWKKGKNFSLLKKFAKTYISNFEDASDLREKLMNTKTLEELKSLLLDYK